MEDDAFEDIGSAAARVVKKAAPDTGGEAVSSAGTLAAGRQGRAHHVAGGGGTDNVIRVNFGTGAAARGPYMPPRQSTTETVDDLDFAFGVPSVHNDPATGGLGDARKREGR